MTTRTPIGAGEPAKPPLFAVHLIDRRSGLPLRANGRRVVAYTKMPRETAVEALAGRDPSLWEVRIERILPAEAGARG